VNADLVTAIEALLVTHPTWARTNTPPRILAEYLARSLARLEQVLLDRAEYFNRPTGAAPVEASP